MTRDPRRTTRAHESQFISPRLTSLGAANEGASLRIFSLIRATRRSRSVLTRPTKGGCVKIRRQKSDERCAFRPGSVMTGQRNIAVSRHEAHGGRFSPCVSLPPVRMYIQGYRRRYTPRLTNCLCLSPAIFSPGYCFARRATDRRSERAGLSRRASITQHQQQRQPARNITAAFPWRIYPVVVPYHEISRTIRMLALAIPASSPPVVPLLVVVCPGDRRPDPTYRSCSSCRCRARERLSAGNLVVRLINGAWNLAHRDHSLSETSATMRI